MGKIHAALRFDGLRFTSWIIIKGCSIIWIDCFRDVDFTSYTEQSAQYLEGERDLSKILGKNGPWLYPALHIYLFALVYKLVGVSENIKYAQIFMLLVHVVTCIFTVKIYSAAFGKKSKYKWLAAICWLGTKVIVNSVRIWYAESINVMFIYIGIYMFQKQSSLLGSLFISIAMGFKMSVLLYVPGVYYLVSKSHNIFIGTFCIIVILLMQEAWALPFTANYGNEYRANAFKFDRNFSINGSINYHWLLYSPWFHSKLFKRSLLVCHLCFLLFVLFRRWLPLLDKQQRFKISSILKHLGLCPPNPWMKFKPQEQYFVAEVLFIWNFIGWAWSRTLHQQFLVWYWFSIPLIMYAPIKQGLF